MISKILKIYSYIEKHSITIITIFLTITAWLLGNANLNLLKYWYCFMMSILLIIRIPDFIKKNCYHYFFELCYFLNILTIFILLLNSNLKLTYPFLHGTFICYSLFMKDKFIFDDLSSTTSFALHSFGTIITKKIYWNNINTLSFSELTLKSYLYYLKLSTLIYLTWLMPYCIYAFLYNGNSITSIKHCNRLKSNEHPSLLHKIYYVLVHMLLVFISVSIGIIMMHSYLLDNIFCSIQVLTSLIRGNYTFNMRNKVKED